MAFGSPQWMYSSGSDYELEQSLKLDDTRGSFLSRTPSSGGNRRTYTISTWIKRGNIQNGSIVVSGADNNYVFRFRFNGGALHAYDYHGGSNQFQWVLQSNAQFRDTSAWYHVLLAVDTTQATNTNRIKMYVNGSQITDLGIASYPSQNYQSYINDVEKIWIGETISEDSAMDGYLAELHFIDGQALTPADFGETGTYGEWKPIEYEGTYGTNGFYLPFKADYTVEGFSTTLYKGSGGTNSLYVGGVGFSPSLVWIKNREANNNGHHFLFDKLRGTSLQALRTNVTNAEGMPNTAYDRFTRFDNDGFSIIGGQYNAAYINSAQPYVAWSWDMGAATPTGFGCVTYDGTQRNLGVGGMGFSPDLLWIKRRSGAAEHSILDQVRGNRKFLSSDGTGAELDRSYLPSFDSDGFTVEPSVSNSNSQGDTYVAWGWNMGGTTVTNTSGSISSQVRANPTYGQSIVSYTGNGTAGATVGHGLSSAPEMIILKRRSSSQSWFVYHKDFGTLGHFAAKLNNSDAAFDDGSAWNDTAPSNSLITFGNSGATNQSSGTFIAYCFHSVSGYSKFGTYTGDATTNHSKSITLGFRPAFLMVKKTSGTGNWVMVDNARNPMSNDVDKYVKADTTDADATQSGELFKFTSTGFTIGANLGDVNANGATYVYMAFAGGMDSISDYNTTGSSDSRVKANTTYGQSIVTYKGQSGSQTVGHGLSSAPEMIIAKNRSSAQEWLVYHANNTAAPETDYLRLDTTAATADNTFWNDTAPTSSVFSVGDSQPINSGHGNDYVAYCWHSVTGYSSIGSWVGNANDTAPVINTGFAPAWVMYKKATGPADWVVVDNVRNPTGIKNLVLHPNGDVNPSESTSADAGQSLIFLSNGFQPGGAGGDMNGNNETYVYMAFADKREYAYWLDQSGNNNDFTSNKLTESDISVDSPTNNFATLNPLDKVLSPTLSEGNLKSSHGNDVESRATMYVSSGKWYWENCVTGGSYGMLGITKLGSTVINYNAVGGVAYYQNNGYKYVLDDGSAGLSYGASYTTGDIIGIAYNADDNEITFYKNNVSQGTITSIPDNTYAPSVSSATSYTGVINFGQDSSFAGNKTSQGNQDGNDIGDFYYTPPTGFLALCTKNLPDVDVVPSEHFNAVTYTANAGTNAITGVGFQPDLSWFKIRSSTGSPVFFDAIRGVNRGLAPNQTAAEYIAAADKDLVSFDSDGFTLGAGEDWASVNQTNGTTHVAWNWKANGSGSSGSSSTGGLAVVNSVNVDAGFSIISWTGNMGVDTFSHGLSKAPEFLIVKNRDNADTNWIVWHKDLATNHNFSLNSTNASSANGQYFFGDDSNMTVPDSTYITIGNNGQVNATSKKIICYAFHSVDGYSKVGSYTGNGSADGTFVYTGFRPAFVLIKRSNSSGQGAPIFDSARNEFNVTDKRLNSNASVAEVTTDGNIDLLSNGFKARNTDGSVNTNGGEYIYIAFAETPFKNSNAR